MKIIIIIQLDVMKIIMIIRRYENNNGNLICN